MFPVNLYTAVPNAVSIIPRYLREAVRIRRAIVSETLFLLDSRKITTQLQRSVADHPMAVHFPDIGRRVMMTGSLVPIQFFVEFFEEL